MDKHFLQSEAWAKFNKHLGKRVFQEQGDGWSFLAILEFTPLGKYLYLPYGPYISDKNGFEGAYKALHKLARAQKVMFVRIEPTGNVAPDTLVKYGFHKTHQVNPERTWVLGLSTPEDEILANMKQNNRNLYHNYRHKGMQVHHTTDATKIHYLTDLLGNVAKHNRITVHTNDYLWAQVDSGAATLYYVTLNAAKLDNAFSLSSARSKRSARGDIPMVKTGDPVAPASPLASSASRNESEKALSNLACGTGGLSTTVSGDSESRRIISNDTRNDGLAERPEIAVGEPQPIIAAALIYDSPTTRYYAHAAADYEHRKLAAGTILVAQMIIDAKKKGLKWFDFYGVTDSDNPSHPWYGFTKFKKSFGGQSKNYLGTWEKPRKRAWYAVFKALSGLKRHFRLH